MININIKKKQIPIKDIYFGKFEQRIIFDENNYYFEYVIEYIEEIEYFEESQFIEIFYDERLTKKFFVKLSEEEQNNYSIADYNKKSCVSVKKSIYLKQ